jgi:hypothetical protein
MSESAVWDASANVSPASAASANVLPSTAAAAARASARSSARASARASARVSRDVSPASVAAAGAGVTTPPPAPLTHESSVPLTHGTGMSGAFNLFQADQGGDTGALPDSVARRFAASQHAEHRREARDRAARDQRMNAR